MTTARSFTALFISLVLCLVSLGCGSADPIAPSEIIATSNPLVAQYNIRHAHAGVTAWVEFGTDTKYGRQTSVVTSSATAPGGEALGILVAGMIPETTYHMRAHVEWPGGSWVDQDQTFTTGPLSLAQLPPSNLPLQLPQISISIPVPGVSPSPGVELLSLVAPHNTNMPQSIVTDLQGNIIWYYPLGAGPIKMMPNGHFILQLGSSLREVDLGGTTIRDLPVQQASQTLPGIGYPLVISTFHHDVLTLPNGHWITLGQTSKAFSDLPGYPGVTNVVGDVILDFDPTGTVSWAWSAFDHLDVNRHLQGLPDWTHSNALVYTPDGNLLISMRHQSWILKIDYLNGTGTGNVLWKLGNEGDFTIPGGDPSQWFYGQHDPVILDINGPQMSLAVYDDGNFRVDSDGVACGTTASAPACYSRATIFQVDESTQSSILLWQDLPGLFSNWGGSIGLLSNGDIEFDNTNPFNSPASQIMEVTQFGAPQIVWQMNITGENAYRGTRIPSLYPSVTWEH